MYLFAFTNIGRVQWAGNAKSLTCRYKLLWEGFSNCTSVVTTRTQNTEHSETLQLIIFTTVKNAVLWVVPPRGSCKNRRFGGTSRLHPQGDKNW
jgi:hypothetical protein